MNTEPRTYSIPEDLLGAFIRRFDKIVDRAERLGVEPPKWRPAGEAREIPVDQFGYRKIKVIPIEVSGNAPRFEGWGPLALIEVDHDNPEIPNIVHMIDEDTDEDPAWRTVGSGCDHCNLNRRRVWLVAVEHDDGARMIVGKSCLRDFLGHESPEQIAGYVESLAFIDDLFEDLDFDSEGYEGEAPFTWEPVPFLAAVIADIDAHGWVARSSLGDPTADRVAALCIKGEAVYGDEHVAEAKAAIAWAAGLPDTADYLGNLAAVAARGEWRDRHLGIAASMAPAYRRATAEAVEAKAGPVSEHFGTVGERITFEAEITRVHRMPGYAYNSPDRAVVSMVTSDGDVAVWFASNADRAPEVGTVAEVTGTVKDHDEFRGTAQTVMTRCKMAVAA